MTLVDRSGRIKAEDSARINANSGFVAPIDPSTIGGNQMLTGLEVEVLHTCKLGLD